MARNSYDDDRVIIERRSGSTLGPLLAGIAIGAGLAILFAPQSGEETRQAIRRKARRARKVAGGYAEDLRDRASGMRDRASDLIDETRVRGREMVDGARDKVEEKVEETRRAIRDKRRELARAVDDGREAARDARNELERRLADAQRVVSEGPIPGRDGDAG